MNHSFPAEQLADLEANFGPVKYATEGGLPYFRIEGLRLPAGCSPDRTDALLCPALRDGYHSRLFLAARVTARVTPNWSGPVHILGCNWYVYSYQLNDITGLRLAQMVGMHLRGLQ